MNRHSVVIAPTKPEIDVFDLYDNFALFGKTTLAEIDHPDFNFVGDGWAAAVLLADGWKLEADDALFRDYLFKKTIHSQELVGPLYIGLRLITRIDHLACCL